jgi:hypothetical protein
MEAKVQHQLIDKVKPSIDSVCRLSFDRLFESSKKTSAHQEKVQEMENAILARDKVIHELRLRLPTTTILDSDKLVSDVMTRPDDFSRLSTVRAAQSTIDSLQVNRLSRYCSLTSTAIVKTTAIVVTHDLSRHVSYKRKKAFESIKKC